MNKHTIDIDGIPAIPIVTSHSIDATFAFCPRKFEFAHVYQQVPDSNESGMAAEVGTALHEALQEWARVWLMPGVDRFDNSIWELAVARGVMTLLEWWPWIQEELAIKDKKLAATQRSLEKSIQLLMVLMSHEFWNDYELATLPDGSAAIEIPWRVIHESHGVHFDSLGRPRVLVTQGKIDFVLRHRVSGEIRVFDLKTTNKFEGMMDAAFRFSGQALGYTFIVSSALGYDAAKSGIQVTYVVASFNDFMIRLKSYELSKEEIQDYLTTRHDLLWRMTNYMDRNWWARRQHGCDSYATACPYMTICHRRDAPFVSAWFEHESVPFVERPRIYESYWTFRG